MASNYFILYCHSYEESAAVLLPMAVVLISCLQCFQKCAVKMEVISVTWTLSTKLSFAKRVLPLFFAAPAHRASSLFFPIHEKSPFRLHTLLSPNFQMYKSSCNIVKDEDWVNYVCSLMLARTQLRFYLNAVFGVQGKTLTCGPSSSSCLIGMLALGQQPSRKSSRETGEILESAPEIGGAVAGNEVFLPSTLGYIFPSQGFIASVASWEFSSKIAISAYKAPEDWF